MRIVNGSCSWSFRQADWPAVIVALSLVAWGGAACDRAPLLAPVGSVINLAAAADELTVNESTEVIALVLEPAGTPVHNGTIVSFTSTLGQMEPAEARTVNGEVRVRLTADTRTGVATITAFSGSAFQTLQITIFPAGGE